MFVVLFDLLGILYRIYVMFVYRERFQVKSPSLPTLLHEQDVTHGQIFKKNLTGLYSEFSSPRPVAMPELNNSVSPTIYP